MAHPFDAQPVCKQIGELRFESGQFGEILLADDKQNAELERRVQQRGNFGGKPLALVCRAENEEFFKLVEDQRDRREILEIEGAELVGQRRFRRNWGFDQRGDSAVKRGKQIAAIADGQRQPVSRREFIHQSALNQAGFADAGRPID